jgi:GH15 family glucan-1,4-alpha-glucosidase
VTLVVDFMAIYGKPKHLLFLAPDMTRQWVFDSVYPFRHRYEFDESIDDFFCFDKKPTIKKSLNGLNIDMKLVAQNSFNSLSILSNLCQLLDINYGFCTWSHSDSKIYENFNVKNYIPNIPQDVLNKKLSSYGPNDENSAYWDIGTDKMHQGVRGHIFHAERFMTILD